MRCLSCGAPLHSSTCAYCGTEVPGYTLHPINSDYICTTTTYTFKGCGRQTCGGLFAHYSSRKGIRECDRVICQYGGQLDKDQGRRLWVCKHGERFPFELWEDSVFKPRKVRK